MATAHWCCLMSRPVTAECAVHLNRYMLMSRPVTAECALMSRPVTAECALHLNRYMLYNCCVFGLLLRRRSKLVKLVWTVFHALLQRAYVSRVSQCTTFKGFDASTWQMPFTSLLNYLIGLSLISLLGFLMLQDLYVREGTLLRWPLEQSKSLAPSEACSVWYDGLCITFL